MMESRSVGGAAAAFVLAASVWGSARAAETPRIEVAFALDATGSMRPWIGQARARIKAIAEDLAAGEPRPEVRFALVAYRDRGDEFVTRIDPFTTDVDVMKAALDRTDAGGGGDGPEAVLEALDAALRRLDWSDDPAVVKLLYLVGDARPNRHADTPSEEDVLALALRRGVVIHTIACGRMSTLGQTFFERVARLSEGRAFRLEDAGKRRTAASRTPDAAVSRAGAAHAGSLAAAVTGTARAYSGAAGVDFSRAKGRAVSARPLPAPRAGATGLLGAEVRWIADAGAWSDLWAAHTSLLPPDEAPAPPPVDFSSHHVLALGGAEAGLELVRFESGDGVRVARVRPAATPGVQFLLVPAADAPVVARTDRAERRAP